MYHHLQVYQAWPEDDPLLLRLEVIHLHRRIVRGLIAHQTGAVAGGELASSSTAGRRGRRARLALPEQNVFNGGR